MNIAGFTFSKIVLIQSLESHEIDTGRILSEYINAEISETNHQIKLEYVECLSCDEFTEILKRLTTEAKSNGEIPIVHVECHGSTTEGLEFENGSTLSWEDLALEISNLNVATQFNLLAVFSACFGGHFIGQADVIRPAPFWCMVAPTEAVDPGEILSGLRVFYSTLLRRSDVGKAASEIRKIRLSHGSWFGQPAETWYETVVTNYVTMHCTKKAIKIRARALRRQLMSEGSLPVSIGSITRNFRRLNRENIMVKFFDIFFQTTTISGNTQRFQNARDRLAKKLNSFRSSSKYVI